MNKGSIDNNTSEDTEENQTEDNNESKNTMMKVFINDIEYTIILEDNETSKSFINLIDSEKTYTMNDLNRNEKYVYLASSLPSNSISIATINSGDIMLYGNDCLVLFYKTFQTSYSYTKIGHIDNASNLESNIGNCSIQITWKIYTK